MVNGDDVLRLCWECQVMLYNKRLCVHEQWLLWWNPNVSMSVCWYIHSYQFQKVYSNYKKTFKAQAQAHAGAHTAQTKGEKIFFLLFAVLWLVFHPCLTLFQHIDWLRTSLLLCQQTYYWIFDLWMVCLLLLRSYFCDRWGRRLMEAVIQFVPPVNFILLC